MDISELAECHLAKLDLGARFDAMLVNWSSKEEEEEEVSKSLRHFEATVGAGGAPPCDKRGGDCRWEDDDRAKSCIRYQREEAKIQAWVNLESAKAEAQSRKLEAKRNLVVPYFVLLMGFRIIAKFGSIYEVLHNHVVIFDYGIIFCIMVRVQIRNLKSCRC
ncbi:unnamed protein product [Urochloa humidicola]